MFEIGNDPVVCGSFLGIFSTEHPVIRLKLILQRDIKITEIDRKVALNLWIFPPNNGNDRIILDRQ